MTNNSDIIEGHLLGRKLIGVWEMIRDSFPTTVEGYALSLEGYFLIGASLHFNVWSLRQKAIDDLAEDLSWAIHNLLNKPVTKESEVTEWESEYRSWCESVSKKLENRAFFTRADQLHFDRLGFVPQAGFAGSFNKHHKWLTSQLNLKFERLRDVINWTQMRPR